MVRRHSFAKNQRPEGIDQEQLNSNKFGKQVGGCRSVILTPSFGEYGLANPFTDALPTLGRKGI